LATPIVVAPVSCTPEEGLLMGYEVNMAHIASQILVLIGLAFWLGRCWAFRWMNMPLASFVAAVLSWAVAVLFRRGDDRHASLDRYWLLM
jgi:hypothetical protein